MLYRISDSIFLTVLTFVIFLLLGYFLNFNYQVVLSIFFITIFFIYYCYLNEEFDKFEKDLLVIFFVVLVVLPTYIGNIVHYFVLNPTILTNLIR